MYMRSLWSILNTRIPGLKRRPRIIRVPWVLRHCPDSKRRVALLVFTFAGLIAHIIFFVAGLAGIFLIPLLLTVQHPDAPVAIPIRWLRECFSHDTAFFIYVVIWGVIVYILIYTMKVFDYLCEHPKNSDETSVSDKSDVAS